MSGAKLPDCPEDGTVFAILTLTGFVNVLGLRFTRNGLKKPFFLCLNDTPGKLLLAPHFVRLSVKRNFCPDSGHSVVSTWSTYVLL